MTTLYLARGHGIQPSGRHDPGAVGNGWSEQDAADVVAPIVDADLTAAGVDVIDEGVEDPNYVGSVREANAAGVDLFVSLHWDWTGGLDVHAFHHSTSTVGKSLATAIVAALDSAGFALADRPVRDRDELYVIGRTTMPAVLVELGRIGAFGDDPTDHLERLGHAVAAGILGHLGIDRPAPSRPAPKPTPPRPEDPPMPATIRRGARGLAVKLAQGALVAHGHAPANTIRSDGSLDGIYGPGTEGAVKSFQRARRLTVDGIVGPNTWAALWDV